MTHALTYAARSLAVALALALPATAQAECYADYKAKQDNPLKLHYGVVAVPDRVCADPSRADKAVARKIDLGGWTLLTVLSVFGPEGLDERKESAGQFFLRF